MRPLPIVQNYLSPTHTVGEFWRVIQGNKILIEELSNLVSLCRTAMTVFTIEE
jgi:hypothetical protein